MAIITGEVMGSFEQMVNGLGRRTDLYQVLAGNVVQHDFMSTLDIITVVGITSLFFVGTALLIDKFLRRNGLLNEDETENGKIYNLHDDTYYSPPRDE